MSTRKRSKQNQPSPRLRARAQAIINSDKYDRDTRESIAFQLKTNYSDLADMVRDAEKGVTICDVEMVHADQRKAARQVVAIINKSAAPDFLTTAMMVALQQAAAIKEINLWTAAENETEDLNVEALADLFAVTQRLSLQNGDDDREKVSAALFELLHNPQTPGGLYETLADFVSSEVNNKLVHSAPVLGSLINLLDDPIGENKTSSFAQAFDHLVSTQKGVGAHA